MKDKKIQSISNKYKCYLIGAIEKTGDEGVGKEWRESITPKLTSRDIFVFDPIKLEGEKMNLSSDEFLKKIDGYKRSGKWELFMEAMNAVWLGVDYLNNNKLKHLLGDRDYVYHSDFLIGYLAENDELGGTIYECGMARDAGIPIYLVTRTRKTDINSSLLWLILSSGGDLFRSFSSMLDFLDGKYNLRRA